MRLCSSVAPPVSPRSSSSSRASSTARCVFVYMCGCACSQGALVVSLGMRAFMCVPTVSLYV